MFEHHRLRTIAFAAVAMGLLGACSGTPKAEPAPVETKEPPRPAKKRPIVDTGQLLVDGKAQLANREEAAARVTFRKAADAGNAQAMVLLGAMYSQGLGGAANEVEAVRMFRKAADLGYARGTYNLGLMYEAGRGVSPAPDNEAKAAVLYKKATGQRGGSGDAAFRLGLLYEQGRGVPRDLAKARQYYDESGIPEAKARIGNLPPE